MKRQIAFIAAAALAAVLLVLPAFGEEKPKSEYFSAVWAVVGSSLGGSTMPIDIRVDRYNTDEDMKKLADLLVEGGQDKLLRALEKEDVGQVSPVGRIGTPLAVARKFVQGNKTIIRLAAARDMAFVELRRSGRSVDYPYTILQLELDEKGNGTGTAITAARIRFNKKENVYEIESLHHGSNYHKLMNVRTMK